MTDSASYDAGPDREDSAPPDDPERCAECYELLPYHAAHCSHQLHA
jgi:hypothetical protein